MTGRPPASQVDVSEKEIVRDLEAATNVRILWEEIPWSGFAEKVNITLASGQLPDAILGPIGSSIILNNLPAFVPIQDMLDDYAPNVAAALRSIDGIESLNRYPDGNVYSLPYYTNYGGSLIASIMYINTTWLDALGLDMPETTEEFRAVLRAFKTQDPNGNGVADEIPLGFREGRNIDYNRGLGALFGSFGVLENNLHLNVVDGEVQFASLQPGYLDALRYLNSLSEEGLLDPEGFTQSHEQYNAKGSSGLYGVFLVDYADILAGDYRDEYVVLPPMRGPRGDALWNIWNQGVPGVSLNHFSITRAAEQPEVLVRWIDYMNSSLEMKHRINYGEEGETWQYFDDGTWGLKTDRLPEGMNYAQYRQTTSFWVVAPVIYSKDEMALYSQDTRMATHAAESAVYGPYIPEESISTSHIMMPEENARNAELFADIDAHVMSFYATSVLEGVSDAQWQANLQRLRALNVDEYVSIYQGYYNRQR